MNVALLHPGFLGVGGAEIVVVNQARYLDEHGCSVRIVTGKVDEKRWADALRGLRVDIVGADSWLQARSSQSSRVARWSRRATRLLSDVDVAVAHSYPMSRVLLESEVTCKRIWYCHEPDRKLHLDAANPTLASRVAAGSVTDTAAERFYLDRRRKRRSWIPGKIPAIDVEAQRDIAEVAKFDRICINSAFTRTLAELAYGPHRYEVLYPLMRLPESGLERRGLHRGELGVLVHSRLEPPKNIDTVLRGFAQFVRESQPKARLHVVGEGATRRPLEELVVELGIAAQVRFHGFLSAEDLQRVYRECEVFALLPIDEPFGMVFPEAIARGLLVLASDHGGPFEIIDRGRLGFACDAFAPEAVAQALTRIVSLSDAEVDDLRQRAQLHCREQLAWEHVGQQMLRAYGVG